MLPNTVYLRNRLHLSGVYDYNKDTKIRRDMLVDVLQNKRYRLFVERSHSNLPGWESGVADRVIKRRPLRVLDCMTFAPR